MKKLFVILAILILTATVACTFSACEEEEIYGIYVSTAPTKVLYYQGEELDMSGCQITVRVSSGNDYVVDVDNEMVSGFSTSLGSHTLIITFEKNGSSYITTQKIQVATHKAVSGEIVNTPSTTFVEGQNITLDGFRALITFTDGIVAERGISSFSISPQNAELGLESVTLTMDAVKFVIPINVVEKEISGIQITQMPYKTEYIESENVDINGLIVKELYNDGSLGLNITEYEITDYKLNNGSNRITISTNLYGKTYTAEFYVTATPLEIISITLQDEDFQKDYILGGYLDYSQIKGEIVSSIGCFAVSSNDLIFSIEENTPLSTTGDIEIIVKYKYAQSETFTTINIMVYDEKKLIELIVYSAPIYGNYTEGEEISYYGLRLYAKYNDKSMEYIFDGTFAELEDLSYTEIAEVGMTTATITYKDKSYSFPITVQVQEKPNVKKEVVKVYIAKEADKTIYHQDEMPDFTGLEIYVEYSDGTIEELLLGNDFIIEDSNFSYPLSLSSTTFTFTYYGISCSYEITITE